MLSFSFSHIVVKALFKYGYSFNNETRICTNNPYDSKAFKRFQSYFSFFGSV